MIQVDPATFEIVSEGGLAKDKNNVYLFGEISPNLDSESFKELGYRYKQTKDGIFILNINLETAKMFEIIKIEGIDIASFEVINFSDTPSYVRSIYDAKDKNNYYKEGVIVDINKDD
jgi:hypothetical protein